MVLREGKPPPQGCRTTVLQVATLHPVVFIRRRFSLRETPKSVSWSNKNKHILFNCLLDILFEIVAVRT